MEETTTGYLAPRTKREWRQPSDETNCLTNTIAKKQPV